MIHSALAEFVLDRTEFMIVEILILCCDNLKDLCNNIDFQDECVKTRSTIIKYVR